MEFYYARCCGCARGGGGAGGRGAVRVILRRLNVKEMCRLNHPRPGTCSGLLNQFIIDVLAKTQPPSRPWLFTALCGRLGGHSG